MVELDEQSPEHEYSVKFRNRPEAYTVAQSILLGLIIASVAIYMGPMYGAFVAGGAAIATIMACLSLPMDQEQPLMPIRIFSPRK